MIIAQMKRCLILKLFDFFRFFRGDGKSVNEGRVNQTFDMFINEVLCPGAM